MFAISNAGGFTAYVENVLNSRKMHVNDAFSCLQLSSVMNLILVSHAAGQDALYDNPCRTW